MSEVWKSNGMGEGYWLNYQTDQYFVIDEHEDWIRENFSKLGVDPKDFKKFTPKVERNDFLFYILKKYPLCRIRENGRSITFEFCSESVNTVLWSIYIFLKTTNRCGDFTWLEFHNLGKDNAGLNWIDFQSKMKNDETILFESLSKFCPNCSNKDNTKWNSKFDKIFEEIMKNSTLKN